MEGCHAFGVASVIILEWVIRDQLPAIADLGYLVSNLQVSTQGSQFVIATRLHQ